MNGSNSGGVIRLKSWQEFKRIANEPKTTVIVYNFEQNAFSSTRELTCLRLILPGQGVQYVFLDFPKEGNLRETGIGLCKDRRGNRYLDDEDVIKFLKTQFGKSDLMICSYWTI